MWQSFAGVLITSICGRLHLDIGAMLVYAAGDRLVRVRLSPDNVKLLGIVGLVAAPAIGNDAQHIVLPAGEGVSLSGSFKKWE